MKVNATIEFEECSLELNPFKELVVFKSALGSALEVKEKSAARTIIGISLESFPQLIIKILAVVYNK